MEITLYLVGADQEDAKQNMPYTDEQTAQDVIDDYLGDDLRMFTVEASVRFDTIEEV